MRIYQEKQASELKKVKCNCCGRELQLQNGIVTEGYFHGKNVFGFFSEKDGICEEFDLCESCYREITEKFVIPVTCTEMTELL